MKVKNKIENRNLYILRIYHWRAAYGGGNYVYWRAIHDDGYKFPKAQIKFLINNIDILYQTFFPEDLLEDNGLPDHANIHTENHIRTFFPIIKKIQSNPSLALLYINDNNINTRAIAIYLMENTK